MTDEQYRGLLTDRERAILDRKADVSDNYYRVVSRTWTTFDALATDIELLEELRTVVCDD